MGPLTQGIPCKNCDKLVSESDGKIFAEVFVCPTCYAMAEQLYNKCAGELRRMLTVLREAIRISLVKGELQYGPAQPLEDMTKEELLTTIGKLTEKKNGSAPQGSSVG